VLLQRITNHIPHHVEFIKGKRAALCLNPPCTTLSPLDSTAPALPSFTGC
jgi:hypothetical protein